MNKTKIEVKECSYCSGIGYFQLLLGGSETCTNCKGTGKEDMQAAVLQNLR